MHTALSFCTDRCHRLARCADLLFQRASTTISMYVSIGGLEEFATLGKKHLHTIIARRTLQDQVHERVWTASAFLQLRFQPATAAAAHLFSYIVMLVCSKFHVEFQMGACTCSRRSPPPPNRHANRMDARAHTSTLAECAPRFMTPRSQGFVGQSSPNLAYV